MADFVNPYTARLQRLRQTRDALLAQPLPTQMYSPEEQARRTEDLNRQRVLGMLGGISNDKAVMNVSEPMLKRAMEAAKPKYTEHGAFDETTGQFHYMPGYVENRRLEAANRDLTSTENAEARAQAEWNAQRQRAEEQRLLRITLAAMKQGGQDEKGSFSYAGTDADQTSPTFGQPLMLHSKRGMHVQTKDGQIVPFNGRIGGKNQEMPAAEAKAFQSNRAGNAQVDIVTGQVADNPKAVGAMGAVPGFISQYLPDSWGGGAQGAAVRAGVANLSSMKIHDRSGAAVTVGEMPRLRPFIPDIRFDSPEVIQTKLNGFRLEYNTILKELESGYPLSNLVRNAQHHGGVIRQPAAPGAPRPAPQPAPAVDPDQALIDKYLPKR